MPDVPRRLPPTPEERLKVVVSRMAGGSNAGQTRWALPAGANTGRTQVAPDPVRLPDFPDIHTVAVGSRDTPQMSRSDVWRDMLGFSDLTYGYEYLIEVNVAPATLDGGSLLALLRFDCDARAYGSNLLLDDAGLILSRDPWDAQQITARDLDAVGTPSFIGSFVVAMNFGSSSDIALNLQGRLASGGGRRLILAPGSFMRATRIGETIFDT